MRYLMDQAPREHQDPELALSACCIRAQRTQNSISGRHTAREGTEQRERYRTKDGHVDRKEGGLRGNVWAQMSLPKAWQSVANPSSPNTFTQPCISGVIPKN